MTASPASGPDSAPRPDEAELARLRDELRALMALLPAALTPFHTATGTVPDSLSDEDAVESGFDNLPV